MGLPSALRGQEFALEVPSAVRVILFTVDESVYSRELAPLVGAYPSVRLGAPWWFLDSPEGMRRFRESATETAGFYNTSGFVDDTRAFASIPARHDPSRRVDAGFLARLVVEQPPESVRHHLRSVAAAARQTRVDRQSAESAHRVRCVVSRSTVKRPE